jgi:hypothetical protein
MGAAARVQGLIGVTFLPILEGRVIGQARLAGKGTLYSSRRRWGAALPGATALAAV